MPDTTTAAGACEWLRQNRCPKLAQLLLWLSREFPALPAPSCASGEDDLCIPAAIYWDAGMHHLSLEWPPGMDVECFWRDRESGASALECWPAATDFALRKLREMYPESGGGA